MKRILMMLTLALAVLLSVSLMPATSTVYAKPTNNLLTDVPITGVLLDSNTGVLLDGGTFEGVLSITNFAFEDGQLLVSGVLEGTATVGGVVTEITHTFTDILASLLSSSSKRACNILFLDLGPISLELLGLEVDLSQIVLDVNAVPGAGKLLGNLLCAVAGLLDAGGPLARILNLLNRINNILG